mmetsp:Transcript_41373/g.97276  ORF Transcript_41373/g.97276 Transcript_41373/m.97276 type:complete len:260 (+) Transcript_41373:1402-2181(+)
MQPHRSHHLRVRSPLEQQPSRRARHQHATRRQPRRAQHRLRTRRPKVPLARHPPATAAAARTRPEAHMPLPVRHHRRVDGREGQPEYRARATAREREQRARAPVPQRDRPGQRQVGAREQRAIGAERERADAVALPARQEGLARQRARGPDVHWRALRGLGRRDEQPTGVQRAAEDLRAVPGVEALRGRGAFMHALARTAGGGSLASGHKHAHRAREVDKFARAAHEQLPPRAVRSDTVHVLERQPLGGRVPSIAHVVH